MAYQICATRIIQILKNLYPTNVWNIRENDQHVKDITNIILEDMDDNDLMINEEIFKKMFTVVYYGLTVRNYIVPDIDPNEYEDCVEEENNNTVNIPDDERR